MDHLRAPTIIFWIAAIAVAGFFGLFFVVFPVLMFIVALFETMAVNRLVPLHPQDSIPPSPPLESALKRGFALIGQFSDAEKGFKRSLISLALSPDSLTLLLIVHRKVGGAYQFITRYSGERWMITSESSGSSNLSDLESHEILRGVMDFEVLLRHHQSRIQLNPDTPISFVAATLPADIHQHDKTRVDSMVNLGLARYVDASRSRWKRTLRASAKIIANFYRTLSSVRGEAQRAQARKLELEWGLANQPDQCLVTDAPPFASRPTPVGLPPAAPLPRSSATSQTSSASPAHRESQEPDIPPLV